MNEFYKAGQDAYDKGKNFLQDNPFPCNDKNHFEWARGWFERHDYYEELWRKEYYKELEIQNKKTLEEQNKKNQEKIQQAKEKRFKNSKRGKAEALGQSSLF